ncbi:MAG TPA: 4-(cytidine 5'-diphospho)-2-C-methyl-D-erythritol kinase [Rhizomicrobium sp.]|nr:4-(cytidine 5'-diphospho)-2-C-methyl-D-erythritol kinase [Rhizomicrobium sp.]
MSAVTAKAAAKINLFLHVGDKRADGFHALQSLAVFAEAGDELEFRPSQDLSLAVRGPFTAGLSAEGDNLVLKAARALNAVGRIVLTKNLPVASGIGGGSADAAAVLRALSDMPREALLDIAASIGSDVPVCVASKTAWMEGRGEILTPVAGVPPMPMLLVNPGVGVSTADVFRGLKTRRGTDLRRPERFGGAEDMLQFLRTTANDLEAPALALQPVIADVLREIEGAEALISRMSGSGATCFGLFESKEHVARAAQAISAAHPGWWVCATQIA